MPDFFESGGSWSVLARIWAAEDRQLERDRALAERSSSHSRKTHIYNREKMAEARRRGSFAGIRAKQAKKTSR